MKVAENFIQRPIATTLVMAAILIFGIFAYQLLPVSDLPNVDFPTILVSAGVPGASPDTMATAVATPLEKQFSTIAGIDSMTSVNSLGSTQITVDPGPLAFLRVTPEDLHLTAGETGEISAVGYDAFGNTVLTQPVWQITEGMGTITPDGLFTAQKAGEGQVVVGLGHLVADLRAVISGVFSGTSFTLMDFETEDLAMQ